MNLKTYTAISIPNRPGVYNVYSKQGAGLVVVKRGVKAVSRGHAIAQVEREA